MLTRRLLAGAAALTLADPPTARADTYPEFLEGVRAEARRAGVSAATLGRALAGLRPLDRVLELDRRQPEFTLTWEQYRDRTVAEPRISNGRRAIAENRRIFDAIGARTPVPGAVVAAIWGLETGFGANTGGFSVVEALATLAWEGRRATFFRAELLAALRILDAGHVTPDRMRGSWAGAMGQPQFMPTSFERLAVDFDGDGRRDIWDSRADALGSIANYLARSGWRAGEPWGFEVLAPPLDPADTQLTVRRPLRDWARAGVRGPGGGPLPATELEVAILLPGGAGGQAFAVANNFMAIRRYNPANFYALCVGLLSDRLG